MYSPFFPSLLVCFFDKAGHAFFWSLLFLIAIIYLFIYYCDLILFWHVFSTLLHNLNTKTILLIILGPNLFWNILIRIIFNFVNKNFLLIFDTQCPCDDLKPREDLFEEFCLYCVQDSRLNSFFTPTLKTKS